MRVVRTLVLLPRHGHILFINLHARSGQSTNHILQEFHWAIGIVVRRTDPLPQTFVDMHIHDEPPEIVALGRKGVHFVRDAGGIPVDLRHLLDDGGDARVGELFIVDGFRENVAVGQFGPFGIGVDSADAVVGAVFVCLADAVNAVGVQEEAVDLDDVDIFLR